MFVEPYGLGETGYIDAVVGRGDLEKVCIPGPKLLKVEVVRS